MHRTRTRNILNWIKVKIINWWWTSVIKIDESVVLILKVLQLFILEFSH
ncbi:hypothetical protein [Mesomycoplasma hyopneumoniae]|nr:hypothetical protein [Mesomycoplasma hyopneumoniae]NYN92301.1 hypothetical protein [Mesomycoplasma hyopneumoniae]UIF67265.1 hypothetical protein KUD10_01285 [Mesomycoplasma hyopneumoniae]